MFLMAEKYTVLCRKPSLGIDIKGKIPIAQRDLPRDPLPRCCIKWPLDAKFPMVDRWKNIMVFHRRKLTEPLVRRSRSWHLILSRANARARVIGAQRWWDDWVQSGGLVGARCGGWWVSWCIGVVGWLWPRCGRFIGSHMWWLAGARCGGW